MEGEERNSKRHSIGLPMNTYMSRMLSSPSPSLPFVNPLTFTPITRTVDGRETFLPRRDFPLASALSGCIFPGG